MRWPALGVSLVPLAGPGASPRFPVPADLWTWWNLAPLLWLPLVVLAALYGGGIRRLGRRGERWDAHPAWRAAAFGSGLLVVFAAICSPLDPLALALLSAHMGQYDLLSTTAPPLLLWGRPREPLRAALLSPWTSRFPARWAESARGAGALLTQPLVVGLLDVAALFVWHVPIVYQASVQNAVLHTLAQLSFLATGLLFWVMVRQPGDLAGSAYGQAIVAVVMTSLVSGGFGFVLIVSQSLLYPIYQDRTASWGLSPLMDQQTAGVVLAVLPELVDICPLIWVVLAWVRAEEDAAIRAEQEGE
ncbi:MAG TPA: cytochrome c oxidase assembly protein [Chloroflexota bacterium]|nr:cytochrome c oxidase assembly protein [Chloroflexota bacterium]